LYSTTPTSVLPKCHPIPVFEQRIFDIKHNNCSAALQNNACHSIARVKKKEKKSKYTNTEK
jgi:hypothetical protein